VTGAGSSKADPSCPVSVEMTSLEPLETIPGSAQGRGVARATILHAARYAAGECRHGERKGWARVSANKTLASDSDISSGARRRAGQKGRARPAATHVGSRKRLIGPRETSLDGRRGFVDAGLPLSRNRQSRGRRVTEAIRPLHASVRLPGAQRTQCHAFPVPGPVVDEREPRWDGGSHA
jgi:hypothetical protein